MKKALLFFAVSLVSALNAFTQVNYDKPAQYIIGDIRVEGASHSDVNAIISFTGLKKDDQITVPGQDLSDAIRKIWKQNIFSGITIEAEKIVDDKIFLIIRVEERPRISEFSFRGVTKSQADDLREKILFARGTIWNPEKEKRAERVISNFFIEKGFYSTKVNIIETEDTLLSNSVSLKIIVDKGKKIKIHRIKLDGNQEFGDGKLITKMKDVKVRKFWRLWAKSKFEPKNYDKAKANLITFYNKNGFRDAQITYDTIYMVDEKSLDIEMRIVEGNRYYYRNISWAGNNKYSSDTLALLLGIEKGDVYDPTTLEKRLQGDPTGRDISSLYLDDGYLFFNIEPIEQLAEGDSIDIELRMYEGPQATIRNVTVEGNTKTSDYVVLRELRTLPGQKFSRTNMMRSHREISALGFFNPETIDIRPTPDPATGTVDIKYIVEEKPSDQLQVQGGYQPRYRDPNTGVPLTGGFIGTVSLAFNNFSTRRFFKPSAWSPIPSGDGQKLSLSVQTNGARYQNYSISFLEPWLGGKKPNSLGSGLGYSIVSTPQTGFKMQQLSASLDFGVRMRFPDDFFKSYTSLSFKNYNLSNAGSQFGEGLANAKINNISVRQTFDRTSLDQAIYPRTGSAFTFTAEFTPPYSAFKKEKDYSDVPEAQKFKFLEFHKWTFNATWYYPIWKNLVIRPRIQMGFLGSYNKSYGISPFERFNMGGSGFGNFSLLGQQFIALRGYPDRSITPENPDAGSSSLGGGGSIFNKFTLELRQPLTLNQAAPIWMVAFLEAGNNWFGVKNYNPFDLKRTAGVGIRVMVPMIGLLGVDWGYGFDPVTGDTKRAGSNFAILFGQEF